MPLIALQSRPCPLCGPGVPNRLFLEANVDEAALGQFAFASRKLPEYMHWRLHRCLRCDVVYADPAPTAEALGDLYQEAAFASGNEAAYAGQTYARLLPAIVKNLPTRKGALDVGAGDGAFLKALLEAGFSDVAGVEPSAAPIAAADPAIKPLIRHDVFRPGLFEANSFDLVTCFQTIEHLHDPARFCNEALRVLKPGGALLLACHNRRALSAHLLGRKSPIFDIEHLQLFSHASARQLLVGAGFRRVVVRMYFNRYPLSYWLRLFPFPARIKLWVLALLADKGPGRLVIPLPAGNLAAVGYKDG